MSCNPFGEKYAPLWTDRRSIISIYDNPSRKYIGDNPGKKEFSLFRIDDYVIRNRNQLKCDYLLIRCSDSQCFFIELKGSDLAHAADQISETINHLKTSLRGYVLNARIVLTKASAPALRSTNYLKLKAMIEDMEGTLIQKSIQLIETH